MNVACCDVYSSGRRVSDGNAVSVYFDKGGKGVMVSALYESSNVEDDFRSVCENVMDGMATGRVPINSSLACSMLFSVGKDMEQKLISIGEEYDLRVMVLYKELLFDLILKDIDGFRRAVPTDIADRFIKEALRSKNGCV